LLRFLRFEIIGRGRFEAIQVVALGTTKSCWDESRAPASASPDSDAYTAGEDGANPYNWNVRKPSASMNFSADSLQYDGYVSV